MTAPEIGFEQQLSLLPPPPTRDLRRPAEPIQRTALVEGNYRRWLKRVWGPGPIVGWGMLNPSDANGLRDDPTLWRIMGFSLRWGFGGLVVGNRYPFISANPAAMMRWRSSFMSSPDQPDLSAREAYIRNCYDVAAVFGECDLHIAAWGNGGDPDDLQVWLDTIEGECSRQIVWHCLGTNADGSPKHPLARGAHRVPDDQRPIRWRA